MHSPQRSSGRMTEQTKKALLAAFTELMRDYHVEVTANPLVNETVQTSMFLADLVNSVEKITGNSKPASIPQTRKWYER